MSKPRDAWLYKLKDGNDIVYYGISNNPHKRAIAQANSGKISPHSGILIGPSSTESAIRLPVEPNSQDKVSELMAQNPKLIKEPVLQSGGKA